MINNLSELSLALIYLCKIDSANDLRVKAEALEDSADKFYQVLVSKIGSDDKAVRYLSDVIKDFGDFLR